MQNNQNAAIPAGWVGGFAESNPAFAYPNPDLSSLPILGNMDNIDLLQRQQSVDCPEFSWETIPGNPASRCFQMFAPDISRLGYTNAGRIYSIICPQQGFCSPSVGCLNVEVTVTGQRGWIIEGGNPGERQVAADMTVEGKIWFSPSALNNWKTKLLRALFERVKRPFPFNKENAIRVTTFKPDSPNQPIFPIRFGENTAFESPEFAKHPEAWAVGHLGVQIGTIKETDSTLVNDFNTLIMSIFNRASGNMLKKDNVLSWNLWFKSPALVDQQEWSEHAALWRESINADHGSPGGEGTIPRYFDGTPLRPVERALESEEAEISAFFETHLHEII
jgi:hypothetical protein